MNIVGKILVILNLVFALAVAGFLITDVVTRTNWKADRDLRLRELESVNNSNTTWRETAERLQNELKTARNKINDLAKGGVDLSDTNQVQLKVKDQEIEALREHIKGLEKTGNERLAAQKRFVEENDNLKKTVTKRDTEILALNDRYQDTSKNYMAEKERADALQARAAALIEELRSARQRLAQLEAQGGSGTIIPVNGQGAVKDPYQANPPARKVKGKIERIHPDDRFLVEVDVGLDDGVDKDHTLEVYRLTPSVEYLGMIRIREADAHHARGRLVRSPYAPPPKALKAGDQVSSSLK